MKVLIITEGNKDVGFGHITRCVALYDAFKEIKFHPTLIINGDQSVRGLVENKNFKIIDWIKSPKKLFNLVNDFDIVVIDSYLAEKDFYQKISDLVKIPVYLDDNKRIDYPPGIILNGSIHAKNLHYHHNKEFEDLLGLDYALLRKEFWESCPKSISKEIQTLMITFGGEDSANMTPKILKFLQIHYPFLKKKVIIGKGFKNVSEIEIHTDNQTSLIYDVDSNQMKSVMMDSDLAISAGGQTLNELACLGVPTIAFAVAHNQLNNVEGWETTNFICYNGWKDDDGLMDTFLINLNYMENFEIRAKKSQIGINLVDGKGALRAVKSIINNYLHHTLSLKPVTKEDIHNIYKLSNEQYIRGISLNSKDIKFNEHEIWFKNKLSDDNCLFLVAKMNGVFAGQIRFDIDGGNAVVSISLVKNYRGMGMGLNIIKTALKILKTEKKNVKSVIAYVKSDNVNSKRFFMKVNFNFLGEKIIKKQKVCQFIYEL
ncbi:MAG: UDP-2,4-diacetamido-2,4,6-trideoxy-beta-L-altropyranose hydrolase [Methanobacterium sp.]